ncbi:hypothetical protein SMD11_3287 [Streptomyces albireticuli]|uniref:Subtilisin inhibitor domain-containing protein n=1 Tax=Streptomyces albireticuli TaxID=1940 RepID=A0A1Z2L3R9_9ACTN|nr:SSI family serine proteinase inhibitor [Streptomyces albireticuli]ARZ68924.1 hypothetical protein SMD11_3287 [Streptomyces albireticuli]
MSVSRLPRHARLPRPARFALAALALAPALLAAPAAASALPLPLPGTEHGDHLVVTVTDSGSWSGTHHLYCHPDGGTYRNAKEACAQLDRQTHWGRDLFAAVPKDSVCTMIYGGPQRARVTGTWVGRRVNAEFNRKNGCEIERWNRFSGLLEGPKSTTKS